MKLFQKIFQYQKFGQRLRVFLYQFQLKAELMEFVMFYQIILLGDYKMRLHLYHINIIYVGNFVSTWF